jgi:hypothetical protein
VRWEEDEVDEVDDVARRMYMEFVVVVGVAMAANACIALGIIGGVLGNDMTAVWNRHALPAMLEELFASRSRTADGTSTLVL